MQFKKIITSPCYIYCRLLATEFRACSAHKFTSVIFILNKISSWSEYLTKFQSRNPTRFYQLFSLDAYHAWVQILSNRYSEEEIVSAFTLSTSSISQNLSLLILLNDSRGVDNLFIWFAVIQATATLPYWSNKPSMQININFNR